jgi:hypothetical protein
MDRDQLIELWEEVIRPADKWLSDVPDWYFRDQFTAELGPYVVECPPGALPDGFSLALRGRHVVHGLIQVFLLVTSGPLMESG